jgi:hypothetical protein
MVNYQILILSINNVRRFWQFTQLDGFNFLQNEGIVVMIPSKWTYDELKGTVWDNMIPHTGVESGPNEDVRF